MTEKQPVISIRNITKRFGNMVAVDDVSLDILEGEFFVLLGPSGCGKTTLLRMLAVMLQRTLLQQVLLHVARFRSLMRLVLLSLLL